MSAPQVVRIDRRRPVRHGSHLVMTILTAGVWGLCVWWPLAVRERRHLARLAKGVNL